MGGESASGRSRRPLEESVLALDRRRCGKQGRHASVLRRPGTGPALQHFEPLFHLPQLQPERLDDAFYEELASYKIGVSVVVAYGSILPERFISLPIHGTLNVHYSLLPKYRGASPIEAAILAGDTETGVAIQKMVRTLDSGPIVAEKTTPIDPTMTAPELREHLSVLGAELLTEVLPKYLTGLLNAKPQDESHATFCTKIQKEDGFLDLGSNPLQNYRKYRAYSEWPRTYFFYGEGAKKVRLIITKASYTDGVFTIERVLPEGKKEMSFEDFKRGIK